MKFKVNVRKIHSSYGLIEVEAETLAEAEAAAAEILEDDPWSVDWDTDDETFEVAKGEKA